MSRLRPPSLFRFKIGHVEAGVPFVSKATKPPTPIQQNVLDLKIGDSFLLSSVGNPETRRLRRSELVAEVVRNIAWASARGIVLRYRSDESGEAAVRVWRVAPEDVTGKADGAGSS